MIETKEFDLRNRRLMLSLGALTKSKYCTYSCPFCYVNSPDYLSFHTRSIDETTQWMAKRSKLFDLIYVSGDTDSFAPPRTEKGIELLDAISHFDADLLFTTRALFQEKHYRKLAEIQKRLEDKGRLFIGCVSISQLNHPHLEPHPIPSPKSRIEQLGRLKEIGLISVLALRPFLPVVTPSEYLEIIKQSKELINMVLGSVWYADKDGTFEKKVFQSEMVEDVEVVYDKMDCDVNEATWKIFKHNEAESAVRDYCKSHNLPFFMRSMPGINWLRENYKKKHTSNLVTRRFGTKNRNTDKPRKAKNWSNSFR